MRSMLIALLVLAVPAAAGEAFVYVHDRGAATAIHGWSFNKKSGEMSLLPGSPFLGTDDGGGCGGLCQTMDSVKVGKQRFLLTGGQLGVMVWTVAKDGTLAEVAGGAVGGAGDWLGTTAVKRAGKTFVYANEYDGNEVHGFELTSDGVLTELPGSPWPTGAGPDGIDSGKDLVVCVNEDDLSLSVYKVQKDGSLLEADGSPFPFATGFSFNVHVDRTGRRVYSSDSDQDVFGFAAHPKTGVLTALEGSPFDCGLDQQGSGMAFGRKPRLVAIDSSTAAPTDPALQLLRRKGSGELVQVGTPNGATALDIEVSNMTRNGRFVVVLGSDLIESLRIHPGSGLIEPADDEAHTAVNPNALVILD